MMKKIAVILAAIAVVMSHVPAFACTSFQLKADDGTVVVGRSNEFGIDAKSDIVYQPSGRQFVSKTPDGGKGKAWKSRYAFLGINGMGLKESYGDGMNEAGLSVEALYFTEGKYETPAPGDAARALSSNDFISWMLSNFATVEEVKAALPSVSVWGENVAMIGGPFLLHFAVHDSSGKCIVIEFIGGEKKVYDNPIGVMTNMPEFPWHVANLRNYVHLDPLIPKPRDFNGVTINPTGTGAGWLGIPGDWTPPSRFVRIAYLVYSTPSAKDREGVINLGKHILNTVDIPLGSVEASMKSKDSGNSIMKEFTQWSILLDLTNRVMYYYSYDDMNLKFIDLKKMAADGVSTVKSIPMSSGFSALDSTGKMKEMK